MSETTHFCTASLLEITPRPSLIFWPTPVELEKSPYGLALFDDFFAGLITRQLKLKSEDFFHGEHKHSLFSISTQFGVIHLFHFVYRKETLIEDLQEGIQLLGETPAGTNQSVLLVHEKIGNHFNFDQSYFISALPDNIELHFQVLP